MRRNETWTVEQCREAAALLLESSVTHALTEAAYAAGDALNRHTLTAQERNQWAVLFSVLRDLGKSLSQPPTEDL